MNSVRATTLSSVYLAMRHIFPEVPISAGAFEPLHVTGIEGTFLDARYPRPVSGCAAEVSQRIAEAVFAALVPAIPDRVTAAPAGTSGNFALGGHDPERGRDYVMYQISGGGYGGTAHHDGLSNGCSTIGISKAPPVEIMEQQYPVLYRRYALHEGSGGAGRLRGGFGLDYEVELLRGHARASFVMDHGRFGPQGALVPGGGQRLEQSARLSELDLVAQRGEIAGDDHLIRLERQRGVDQAAQAIGGLGEAHQATQSMKLEPAQRSTPTAAAPRVPVPVELEMEIAEVDDAHAGQSVTMKRRPGASTRRGVQHPPRRRGKRSRLGATNARWRRHRPSGRRPRRSRRSGRLARDARAPSTPPCPAAG
jgi:hypothetical protein